MSDYFHEMGRVALANGQAPNHMLHMRQFLRDAGEWDLFWSGADLPPPASKLAVKKLPEIDVNSIESKQKDCPICLKEFQTNDKVILMPCKHVFHKTCIQPWLQKTNSCPICRSELPTDDEDYELYKKGKARELQRERDLEILHNAMFG